MRRRIAALILIATMAIMIAPVYAATIRIDPHTSGYPDPIMLSSPATFNISDVSKTDYDPHILLVMSNDSYDGLSGNVLVEWTGGSTTFLKTEFIYAASGFIPGDFGGDASYEVASCESHLGALGVWYAFGPFLASPIDSTNQTFTITASSTAMRMLVYAIGRQDGITGEFDNKVPNTQPGFVIPEPAIIILALAPFAALGLFYVKRKRA
jgi:hypothetical protein